MSQEPNFIVLSKMKFLSIVALTLTFLQDADSVDSLLDRLDSDSIEVRESATKHLIRLGLKVRPRILNELVNASPSRRARLKTIATAIELQPASLPPLIDEILSQHPASIHRLVRDTSHRFRLNLEGRDWSEVRDVMKKSGMTLLKYSERREEERHGFWFTYVARPEAWVAPGNVKFDLRLSLCTRFHFSPGERTRHVVESAEGVWVAAIDRPFSDVKKAKPFPAGTILEAALGHEVTNKEVDTFPILKEMGIAYSFRELEFASSDEPLGWIFSVNMEFASADRRSGWHPSVYAASGLDPASYELKTESNWTPSDTLGPIRSTLGSKWGAVVGASFPKDHVARAGAWTLIDVETRKAWIKKQKPISEPNRHRAYSVPDLEAADSDIEDLQVLIPDLKSADLASLKRLAKIRCMSIESTRLDSEMIGRLSDVPTLRVLDVDTEDSMTLECFQALAALPLESLNVGHGSGLCDDALYALSRSHSLRVLTMTAMGEPVSDKGIAHLARMSELKELELWSFHDVTNDGLAALANLKALKRLSVAYLRKTGDRGLKSLCSLPSLEKLELIEVNVTDEGLLSLVKAEKLKYFHITQCVKITQTGIEALKARLPANFELKRGWWSN